VTKKAAIFITAVGLAAALYFSLHRHMRTRAADSPAPAVALVDLDGSTIDLSTYKGRVLLINFWAAWCVPCRQEVPRFIALEEKYRPQGFQAVGISLDDPEAALRDFCRQYKVNYPIVMGNQKIAEAFGGVLGLPTTFLIGRDGRIHAKYVGSTDFTKVEQEITVLLKGRSNF